MDASKVEAAAKAAYPELWPADGAEPFFPKDWDDQQRAEAKAILAHRRTEITERIAKALEAVGAASQDDTSSEYSFALPDDVAIVEQTLVAFSYLDKNGQTAFGVRTIGDGILTTWIGMGELAKHYLLTRNAAPGDWNHL